MTDEEKAEFQLKLRKYDAEIENLRALTAKASKEAKWYELVIASGATLALVAIVKLFV
ncbi:MAG: hypothetical protein AAF568_09545 [Pseudomonadota bacterium]